MAELLLDGLIIGGLIALAIQAVIGRSLFRSIIHFVVMGLTLALAWARLGAPDLAMAEAAIGAGVTGALMLVAYRRLIENDVGRTSQPPDRPSRLALPIAISAGALVGVLGLAAIQADSEPALAGQAVLQELAGTGIGNPITGVLLIFRGLDTLLEVAVLFTALLAARAVAGGSSASSPAAPDPETPLIGALLAVVLPLTLLVSVHLLRAGTHEPGGAFQGGAVLAAAGVLLILSGRVSTVDRAPALLRMGLLAGLVSFMLIGLSPLVFGQPFMSLPGYWAIYFIETAMMLSIALTLVMLFAGSGGLKRARRG